MDRCIHRMIPEFCSFCRPPRQPEKTHYPAGKSRKRVLPLFYRQTVVKPGFVTIKTAFGPKHPCFALLSSDTTFVHIDGHPYRWAIEIIVKLAPNLSTIQITPAILRRVNLKQYFGDCLRKNISIVVGKMNLTANCA